MLGSDGLSEGIPRAAGLPLLLEGEILPLLRSLWLTSPGRREHIWDELLTNFFSVLSQRIQIPCIILMTSHPKMINFSNQL